MIKLYTDLKKSKRDVLSNFREKLLISLKTHKRSDYPKFDGNIGFSVFENIYAPKSIGVYFIHDLGEFFISEELITSTKDSLNIHG